MINTNKEYFFLLYLNKPKTEENDQVKFISLKENAPKCIWTKEENDKIIKIFTFNSKVAKESKAVLEFYFVAKRYKITLESIKGKTFLFDIILQKDNNKIEQNKIILPDKMNYFCEALNTQKEYQKLETLYSDSIKLCSKKPSFHLLINIFVRVYNMKLCSDLLGVFSENIDKAGQKDNINKDKLIQYKHYFEQICENSEDLISKYSFNKIDFYGLILTYLNNCLYEKYKDLFDELYKSDKSILFAILLKYKLYFKKQINLHKEFLNEIIKFSAKKDFKKFKEDGLFYLKDINTFIEITENNKDEIIKIKGFKPIEIPKVKDNEKIDFGIINPKIEEIITFSKDQKILLINFKTEFWDRISSQCSGKSRDNIELCSTLRILFNKYYEMIIDLFKEEKDNKIKKEITSCFKKGIFEHKLDKIIKEYIQTNAKITNIEIIELIKDYNKYYSDPNYINRGFLKYYQKSI